MYGKLFASMFGGSLHGYWQAIVTFQQMIILADKDGTIEMTPSALSATTSIPIDIIEAGIAVLEAPDRFSRTPDEDGRRIIRIDPDRPWGWHITNYAHYRSIRTSEERREYHKKYWHLRKKRAIQPDSTSTQHNQPIAVSSKQYAEAVKTKIIVGVSPQPHIHNLKKNQNTLTSQAIDVINFLNETTGRKFRSLDGNNQPTSHLRLIMDRLKTGVTVQDCKTVIIRKHRDWAGDDKMWPFLRPSTLFRASNFENYFGECTDSERRRVEK